MKLDLAVGNNTIQSWDDIMWEKMRCLAAGCTETIIFTRRAEIELNVRW